MNDKAKTEMRDRPDFSLQGDYGRAVLKDERGYWLLHGIELEEREALSSALWRKFDFLSKLDAQEVADFVLLFRAK